LQFFSQQDNLKISEVVGRCLRPCPRGRPPSLVGDKNPPSHSKLFIFQANRTIHEYEEEDQNSDVITRQDTTTQAASLTADAFAAAFEEPFHQATGARVI